MDVVRRRRTWIGCAALLACILGIVHGPLANGDPLPKQETGRTKIADGEYAIYERDTDGSVGPFQEEVCLTPTAQAD
jgi:hypothetical protein